MTTVISANPALNTNTYNRSSAPDVNFNTATFECVCTSIEVKTNAKGEQYANLEFQTQAKRNVPVTKIITSADHRSTTFGQIQNKGFSIGRKVMLVGHLTGVFSHEVSDEGFVLPLDYSIIRMTKPVITPMAR